MPLNSGDLTNLTSKERFSLEERTACLVNFTGVCSQEVLKADTTGVPKRKFYKILANVILDWNWLSSSNPKKFNFSGVGALVWIPNRFGGIGQILSHIEYTEIKKVFGLFPDMIELFGGLSQYSKFGGRFDSENQNFHFPACIPYDKIIKSSIKGQEQHFWKIITESYAPLDDPTLDALASCRNTSISAHVLWTQFVFWKRFTGKALDILRQEEIESLSVVELNKLKQYIDSANKSISYINRVLNLRSNIESYINYLRNSSKNNELYGIIPCTNNLKNDLLAEKYNGFIVAFPILKALQDICNEYWSHIGLLSQRVNANLETIENRLDQIKTHHKVSNIAINSTEWCAWFLSNDSNKNISQSILTLIENTYSKFEISLGIQFLRRTDHYRNFINNYYPLPVKHFIRGY